MFAAVLTTIQEPTRGVVKLVEKLAEYGGLLVVAGDNNSPRTPVMATTGPADSRLPIDLRRQRDCLIVRR